MKTKTSGGAGGGPARCLTVPGDWKAAASQFRASSAETVPDGWRTRIQLEAELDLARAQTQRTLNDMVAAGAAEMRRFRIQQGARPGLYPVPHYRLK